MTEDVQERKVTAATALSQAGNWRGAVRHFRDALRDDPRHTGALEGLARAYISLREYPKAQVVAAALLRVSPDLAIAHRMLAVALVQQGKHAEGLRAARQAIALAPREALGRYALAWAYTRQNNLAAAIPVCREGLALAPTNADLMALLANALLDTQGRAAAEPLIINALELSPRKPFIQLVAARVALARGQMKRARALLESLLRQSSPTHVAISLYLFTESRHVIPRGLFMFRYWRLDRPRLAGLTHVVAMMTLVMTAAALSVVTCGLSFALGVAVHVLLKWRIDVHRKAVVAHSAKYVLSPDY